MAYFNLKDTLAQAPAVLAAGITDLNLMQAGGRLWLQATGAGAGGLAFWDVTGTPVLAGQLALPRGAGLSAPVTLTSAEGYGQDMVWLAGGAGQGITGYLPAAAGGLVEQVRIDTGAEPVVAVATAMLGGRTFVFSADRNSDEINVWRDDGQGMRLVYSQEIGTGTGQTDRVQLARAEVGGATWLLAVSAADASLSNYRVDATTGALSLQARIGADGGLGIATPTDLQVVTLLGQTYALVGAAGTSSVSVVALESDGGLRVSDQVNDDLNTRFAGVTAFEVIETADRVYVLVGGADGGMTLMTLLPWGRLVQLETLVHQPGLGLETPVAFAATVTSPGRIAVFASSDTSGTLTSWEVNVGQGSTQMGSGRLTGGRDNDILSGLGSHDRLEGGAGRDILSDGGGRDTLIGGDGADVFVLARDGYIDRINDFEPGVDRLDLSAFGRVYDLSALSFNSFATGVRIRFGSEAVDVYSRSGQPLFAGDFELSDLFDLWHADVQGAVKTTIATGGRTADLIEGKSGDDRLAGAQGNDTLMGYGGDDTLNGGRFDVLSNADGADRFIGGAGRDWVSYEGSFGSLLVDLLFSTINTFAAAGDTYDSIENLIGSQGFDNLRGTHGDNHIIGGRNVDYIFGRQGNDTLEGGIGDDVLFGGPGADVLDGGANMDRAQYSQSATGLLLDLMNPGLNTGEAAGDTYISIEGLAGGFGDDQIFGDTGANQLFGREGADRLYGREGADYLNGGAHSDRLAGGTGSDTLRGGTHNDTFVFNDGHDVIEDFNFSHGDVIQVDSSVITEARGLSSAQVVTRFGQVRNGEAVLDFGHGDILTIESLSTLTGLANNLEIL